MIFCYIQFCAVFLTTSFISSVSINVLPSSALITSVLGTQLLVTFLAVWCIFFEFSQNLSISSPLSSVNDSLSSFTPLVTYFLIKARSFHLVAIRFCILSSSRKVQSRLGNPWLFLSSCTWNVFLGFCLDVVLHVFP